jgi:hypothetical protein
MLRSDALFDGNRGDNTMTPSEALVILESRLGPQPRYRQLIDPYSDAYDPRYERIVIGMAFDQVLLSKPTPTTDTPPAPVQNNPTRRCCGG